METLSAHGASGVGGGIDLDRWHSVRQRVQRHLVRTTQPLQTTRALSSSPPSRQEALWRPNRWNEPMQQKQQQQLRDALNANIELEHKLKMECQRSANLAREVNELRSRCKLLDGEVADLRDVRSDLEQKLHRSDKERSSAEEKRRSMADVLDGVRCKVRSSQQPLYERATSAESEAANARDRAHKLALHLSEAASALQRQKRDRDMLDQKHAAVVRGLKQRLRHQHQQATMLSASAAQYHHHHHHEEEEQETTRQKRDDADVLRRLIVTLKRKLKGAEDRLRGKNEELESLGKQLRDMQAVVQQNLSKQGKDAIDNKELLLGVKQLKAEIEHLIQCNSLTKSEKAAIETELQNVRDDNERLKEDQKQMQRREVESVEEIKKVQRALVATSDNAERLTEEREQALERLRASSAALEALQSRVDEVQEQRELQRSEVEQWSQDIQEELQMLRELMHTMATERESEKEQAQNHIGELRHAIDVYKSRLSSAKRQIRFVVERNEKLDERLNRAMLV